MAIQEVVPGKPQETHARPAASGTLVAAPPLLESGDRMTRREFERRYRPLPRLKKAELIEGVVYMPSPVHYAGHAEPHSHIIGWLVTYCAATPGVKLADNAAVRLDIDNEVQPDALLRLEPATGGRSHISEDDYIEGPPELLVEIAASSATIDLREKLRVYQRNGAQEYIVWQVYDKRIDWFHLSEGEYVPSKPDESGVIHSLAFPGLRLAVSALLEGNLAQVLAVLQQGLATAEHIEFAARVVEKN